MLNTLKQSADTHVPGEGHVLPGLKSYIVGALMVVIGGWLTKWNVSAGVKDWANANLPALLTILLGSGTITLRAAIAKVHDTLKRIHGLPQ